MRRIPVREIGIASILFLSLVGTGFAGGKKSGPYAEFTDSKIFAGKLSLNIFEVNANEIYESAHLKQAGLDSMVFLKAITGFYNLKAAGKLPENSNTLTIIDYLKTSTFKRMWIVDIQTKTLLLQTWVAHGEGSGLDIADSFSNNLSSYQSSLGFFLTDVIYSGKHGRSLKLIGLDEGFNDHAFVRNIVIHAAKYVSQRFIEKNGRLGRSQGCPAVCSSMISQVINLIKGNTVIFANGNDSKYNSKYLNMEGAAFYSFNNKSSQSTFNTQDTF